VFRSTLVMMLAQMGSLNALEQAGNKAQKESKRAFWKRWIGGTLPSADTIGRVSSQLQCDGVRAIQRHLYSRLKRNKALRPAVGNRFSLLIDGHESSASYLRYCTDCLRRLIHTKKADRIQYYHRNVTAVLACKDFPLLLDVELQQPGEDEVAAAKRLLQRVLNDYPRAFDIIAADGLYVRQDFFRLALDHGKEVIATLKDERRDLLKDARGLFGCQPPVTSHHGPSLRQCWDIEHFTSWTQLGEEVRVVRSLETTTLSHHKPPQTEQVTSDWIWATTASSHKLSTEMVIAYGHGRWDIENKELNELVTYWHADHLYKHNATAIVAFWLLTMLAYNLFHAFIYRNLKPVVRRRYSKLHLARVTAAEIYCLPPQPT